MDFSIFESLPRSLAGQHWRKTGMWEWALHAGPPFHPPQALHCTAHWVTLFPSQYVFTGSLCQLSGWNVPSGRTQWCQLCAEHVWTVRCMSHASVDERPSLQGITWRAWYWHTQTMHEMTYMHFFMAIHFFNEHIMNPIWINSSYLVMQVE